MNRWQLNITRWLYGLYPTYKRQHCSFGKSEADIFQTHGRGAYELEVR